jgi:signal transduction histidine kinase
MTDQFDQLLEALETERNYVAKELHDGVAQSTLQLGLQAGICQKLMGIGKLDMLADELAQLEERIQLASRQVREIIGDMRPPIVEPEATLDDYIRSAIDIHIQRGGPPVTYEFGWPEDPPDFSHTKIVALVRIIQEALFNTRKHARAQNVSLTLSVEDGALYVVIADDGQGFDVTELETRSVAKGGAGITNMRMRARAIGGSLDISGGTTRSGTEIVLRLAQ